MSIIRCPECKQMISSTVESCPHCGYTLSSIEREAAIDDAKLHPITINDPQQKTIVIEKKGEEDQGSAGGGFVLSFFLGIIGLIIALCVGKKATKSGAVTGFIVQAGIGILILIITSCSQ